tara:strand:+ start:73 stop:609 length:537 start_codon:yes stop_codon:yes gene_type:complete
MKLENWMKMSTQVHAWLAKEDRGARGNIIALQLELGDEVVTDVDFTTEEKEEELGLCWSVCRDNGKRWDDFPKARLGRESSLPVELSGIAETAMTQLQDAFANLPTNVITILLNTFYMGLGRRGGNYEHIDDLTGYVQNHCMRNMVTAFKEGRFVEGDENGLPKVEAPPLKNNSEEAE